MNAVQMQYMRAFTRNPLEVIDMKADEIVVMAYQGIGDVIRDYENLVVPGRFYATEKVTPENIRTLQLSLYGKKDVIDYVTENGQVIPEQLTGEGYFAWFDSATVQDIIDNEFDKHPNASDEDIIAAILYYSEHDDFID